MKFAFRVDATPEMGTGHVMRCLTLADGMAARGAAVRFVSRRLPDRLRALLRSRGYGPSMLSTPADSENRDGLQHSRWLEGGQLEDAQATVTALRDETWDWVVVDHYALASPWETVVRASGARVAAIDDLADRDHDCDVLVDQNLYQEGAGRYARRVPAGCSVLAGPRYALLRDEFRHHRTSGRRDANTPLRLLVSFGGADPRNLTGMALTALAEPGVAPHRVDVVIGAEHPAGAEIAAACRDLGYTCHVQTDRMAELMALSDLALGAGGISVWERCCIGLPALAIACAANHRRQVESAAAAGLLVALDADTLDVASLALHLRVLLANAGLRQALAAAGRGAVDGMGGGRVLRALGYSAVCVRPARPEDAAPVLAWRNHPEVVRVSRSAAPVAEDAHAQWFTRTLADANRHLLIGERAGEPVGVARFDVADGCAEVSIYLVPGPSEPGTGSDLLAAAEAWLRERRRDVFVLKAEVLRDNSRSHGLFRANGYEPENTVYSKRLVP